MKPSKRETEILFLCSNGATIKEIAATLGLSKHTVMCYAVKVKIKLKAKTMTHAVAIAFRNGYIK